MTKESFAQLLSDLYDIYQPAKKADITNLLDKYNGQEFDAVYHLLFKYNYPKSEHYNPEIGTPANIKELINKYSAGERTLTVGKPTPVNQQELIDKKVQEANEQLQNTVKETTVQVLEKMGEKVQNIEEGINQKLQKIQEMELAINQKIQEFFKMSKTLDQVAGDDDNVEVKLNILWNEKELIIPKNVSNMCIGTRFLVFDVEQKFHGLEIKDITEDFISSPGKCIKEITIDKV